MSEQELYRGLAELGYMGRQCHYCGSIIDEDEEVVVTTEPPTAMFRDDHGDRVYHLDCYFGEDDEE